VNIFVMLGLAAVGYYVYSQSQTQGTAAPAQTATAPAPTSATAIPAPAATTTAAVYSGPYPQVYQAVVTAALQGLGAGAGNSLQSPDVWNWYLEQAEPAITAPAPEAIFPGNSAPHAPVPFTAWWQAVVPLLPAGLSGLGDMVHAAYADPQNPVASHMASRWYV
jgi:hypothetical protein